MLNETVLEPAGTVTVDGGLATSLSLESRLIAATAEVQAHMTRIWRLLATLGPRTHRHPRQIPLSPGLVAIFASEPDSVRVDPETAARRLKAMTLTLTHPLMTDDPATPTEIVDAFLYGVATGPDPT